MATNGASISAWIATAQPPRFAALAADESVDVCIIGAGIAGLTCAYLLLQEGKSVLVIDAHGVGAGETGRTTAHFFPPDERYFRIADKFGMDKARLVADSYRQAIETVASIVQREGIDCDFERLDGYLFNPSAQWDHTLEQEFKIASQLGLDVSRAERVPGLDLDTGPCLRFAGQAQFHPMKYLNALAAAIAQRGGRICGDTRASEVRRIDGREIVDTPQARISAAAVIVATNTPFIDRVVMHTKQSGYRTYVLGIRVPKGAMPHALLWDTGDPYYYVRLARLDGDPDGELLIVGGQDHKTGQDDHPQHRYDEIESWVRQRFGAAQQVLYRWSGEVMEPSDGLAFLGRNPMDNSQVYIITGDSGNGMTHCTAGALLVTDLIMGRQNPWERLYSPARKPLHGMGDFFSEQANTISQYADWLRPGEVEAVEQIAPGEGATVRVGTSLLAVYRDAEGGLTSLSAACTHLGCAVHWNSGEKSWDCPCHGSRFATGGEVLHGPAKLPLASAELPTPSSASRPGQASRTAPPK